MVSLFATGTDGVTNDVAGEVADAQRVLDEAAADHAFTRVLDHARDLGNIAGVQRLGVLSRRIAAVEAELLAEHVQGDGNTFQAERVLADGRTSKRERRRKANRAKAVGHNTSLAAKVAAGSMSEEQLDNIAKAANETDGEAASDNDLIDRVADATPEQGKAIVNEYLADRATKDQVQREHDRQRALRRTFTYTSKKHGLATITIEGDHISIAAMWDSIEDHANTLYGQDGGRDLPHAKHPRNRSQRLYDAAHHLLTGGTPTGSSRSRPRIVIALTLDQLLGLDHQAMATQIGIGLIPDSVLAKYVEHAEFLTAIYDHAGEPLWLGRLKRHATTSQMIALTLRDKGCVLCGAHPNKCQAHHRIPWSSPARGKTDLNDLVLLCEPCHIELHANNNTIYRHRGGTWKTRPATRAETPAPRPNRHRNTPKQE